MWKCDFVGPLEAPGEGSEEVDIEDTEDQDAEEVKTVPDPGQPSDEERENHRIDRYPFRSWCKHCLSGRGTGQGHRRNGTVSDIPRIGIDYFFITPGGDLDEG